MRKFLGFLFILLSMINPSYAYFIETNWEVVDFVGAPIFIKPENVVGKRQYFEGGFAKGVFYSCDFAGQYKTYTYYKKEEFLSNPEFEPFKRHNIILEEDIFVHRISCNGSKEGERKVLYPFVTQSTPNKAFYLFEDVIFMLVTEDYPREIKPWTN